MWTLFPDLETQNNFFLKTVLERPQSWKLITTAQDGNLSLTNAVI